MVRRWSYVNTVNNNFYSKFQDLNFAHFETSFKANIFYKKNINVLSKLTRKSWARRKHLNNWLIYQNIFSNWSNEYLFFKQYSKHIFNLNFFRNSFLTYNYNILKKSNSLYIKDTENWISNSFISRISNYSSKLGFKSYQFFSKFKHNAWFFISSNNLNLFFQNLTLINPNPLYTISQSQLYPISFEKTSLFYIIQIYNELHRVITSKSVELYKINSLLLLFNVLKPN
jgi:hypothetical protein